MNLSPMEIGLIVVLAFVLFGPKRLPEMGRSLGEGIREFRKSISGAVDEAAHAKVANEAPKAGETPQG